MKKLNTHAWDILLESEKTALNLQYVTEKSSWQAGEIMKKSHYKYLEIKYRAERFLKLFTEYFTIHPTLIPEPVRERYTNPGAVAALFYLERCILKRAKPFEALNNWNEKNEEALTKSEMNDNLEKLLSVWAESDDLYEMAIFNMVKEFDRWNNFRILPKNCQEPSAYKRRLKNVQKRRVKLACSLSPLALEKIVALFGAKKQPCLFLPILVESKIHVLRVKDKPKIVEILSDFNLYLFKEQSDATTYADLIQMYVVKSKRECQDGLAFWPNYRTMVKKAINFDTIDNITPTRRHLQMAINKHEFY